MRPLRMESRTFKPLPAQFLGAACVKCNKLQSKWCLDIPNSEITTVCALCVLYEYPWGLRHREQIDEFVSEVEATRGTVLEKSEDGRITSIKDADGIVGAIVLTSRLFHIRDRVEFDG